VDEADRDLVDAEQSETDAQAIIAREMKEKNGEESGNNSKDKGEASTLQTSGEGIVRRKVIVIILFQISSFYCCFMLCCVRKAFVAYLLLRRYTQ